MSNRYDIDRASQPVGREGSSFKGPTALFVLALVPLTAAVAGLVSPASGLMLGGALFVGASLQAAIGQASARRGRAQTDRLIIAGRGVPAELAWRTLELTSDRQRTALAKSLRELVNTLGDKVVMTAQVVNRSAARPQRARLTALADRLSRLDEPVDARGVLLVRGLLADGGSPLYDRRRAAELPERLDFLLRQLEPRR